MTTKSKGIVPRVEPNANGEYVCKDCGKPWKSTQAYSMHWYRTHGGRITPPHGTKNGSKSSFPSSDPEYRRNWYKRNKERKEKEAMQSKSHRGKHPTEYYQSAEYKRELKARKARAAMANNGSAAEVPALLDECPCCHLPLKPIIDGIKAALEERLRRHAHES